MKKYSVFILCLLFILYLGLFSFQKIDLATADIGRHLENGKIMLEPEQFGTTRSALLNTNFFSYTNPDFPFVNHHWGSGILLYLFFSVFGFGGLSLLYFSWIAGALIFIILSIYDEVDLQTLCVCGIFLIPLIADRTEIRPEGLSFLFLAIFFFLLYKYSKNATANQKFLWIIPAIELLWVNMHIYFIFGIYIVGIFLFQSIILKQWQKVKNLSLTLLATTFITLLNPYGWKAIIYPFIIFRNYGYRIVENQSIPFLENLSFANPAFLWFKISVVLIVLSTIWILLRTPKKFQIAMTIMAITFAILGYTSIRNIALFGLFALPLLSYNIYTIWQMYKNNFSNNIKNILYGLLFVIIIFSTLFHFSTKMPWNRNFGIGLADGELDSVNFINENNLHGPIFNNYDIGGLIIFSLYPQEKVFVDNRPEAYPA